MESIKCFLILNNMLNCLELENDDDYSGWYIPDAWKKNPDDTKVMDKDEKSATIATFKEEIKVQDLIDEFEAMAKRGTLLTGSGVTQQDILIQILGVITVVAMKN